MSICLGYMIEFVSMMLFPRLSPAILPLDGAPPQLEVAVTLETTNIIIHKKIKVGESPGGLSSQIEAVF